MELFSISNRGIIEERDEKDRDTERLTIKSQV